MLLAMLSQVQLSKSVADRDHALFEADQLRSHSAKAETGFKEERARAESEAAARASLDQLLSSCREQSQQMRVEVDTLLVEGEESRRKLRQAAEERRRLEGLASTQKVCEQTNPYSTRTHWP